MLISVRLVAPLQACTAAGGRFSALHNFSTLLSSAVLQLVSNGVLSSLVQSSYPFLLCGICLHDYGLSFRNLPTADNCGIDDDQGDGGGDSESGVEGAGLGTKSGIGMCCVRWICFSVFL